MSSEVGLLLILLDGVALRTAIAFPVDVPDVIARHIFTMLHELDGKATIRTAMVADAQGAPFYIMRPIPPAGRENEKSDVFSPSENQRVGWNELSTTDPAGARRFYGEQFGWDSSDFMDMGEMGEYRFLDHHGTRIGALCGVMPGGQPKWRFYFRVPSIEAAKQTAEDSGGTIHIGPHQVPTGDWIIIGSDPQGAEFALVGGE